MHIYSLSLPLFIDIYAHIDDKQTQSNFKQVSKCFESISEIARIAAHVNEAINESFYLLDTSSITKLTLSSMFRWTAVLLGEIHCAPLHREVNSRMINVLWQIYALIPSIIPWKNIEVYLETQSDNQIPSVLQEIKNQIQCWNIDTRFIDRLFYLLDRKCEICRDYVNFFEDDSFNFKDFSNSYRKNKNILTDFIKDNELDDFFSTEVVEELCQTAEKEKDRLLKKKNLLELTKILYDEASKAVNYFSQKLKECKDERNSSLIQNMEHSIVENKLPILVAGLNHVTCDMVRNFSKKRLIIAIAPKNQKRKELDTNYTNDSVESSSDFWSELAICLKTDASQQLVFYSSNDELFETMKRKMKSYKFDPSLMALWGTFPMIIYLRERIKMENDFSQDV